MHVLHDGEVQDQKPHRGNHNLFVSPVVQLAAAVLTMYTEL